VSKHTRLARAPVNGVTRVPRLRRFLLNLHLSRPVFCRFG